MSFHKKKRLKIFISLLHPSTPHILLNNDIFNTIKDKSHIFSIGCASEMGVKRHLIVIVSPNLFVSDCLVSLSDVIADCAVILRSNKVRKMLGKWTLFQFIWQQIRFVEEQNVSSFGQMVMKANLFEQIQRFFHTIGRVIFFQNHVIFNQRSDENHSGNVVEDVDPTASFRTLPTNVNQLNGQILKNNFCW